ncbi:MAG: 4Fe-4S dicluster domain-containing protein [Acidobacteria bacterium]|nr:4Fe-4S dicluster domain-containing protein [Acidobacteriota bacterium]
MPQWGMVIDLDRCTGCNACVAACHAENNLPIAGEEEAAKGRSFHWIRIERYIEGEYPNLKTRFIPVLCQHCDEAPCEPVCPVFATYHSPQGLNVQVYNRCIGTRFCANACPYTVRHFNWFDPRWPEPLERQLNPEVSVRTKGMIEKCTFCIQRIRKAADLAKDEERPVGDGEVQPACAQSCPTDAIVFGDLSDPGSRVSKLASQRRAFRLQEDLGTQPRVIYLKEGSE